MVNGRYLVQLQCLLQLMVGWTPQYRNFAVSCTMNATPRMMDSWLPSKNPPSPRRLPSGRKYGRPLTALSPTRAYIPGRLNGCHTEIQRRPLAGMSHSRCAKVLRANTHARENLIDHHDSGAQPLDMAHYEAHSDTGVFEPVPNNNRSSCGKCGEQNDSLISCQKCNSVSYCDKACLEKDLIRHKFVCRLGRPLDEVDYFIRACHEETMPTDDDVTMAFGICFFTSGVDRQRLFRLNCDLINRWGVSEEELRQGWKSDKLKELIQFRDHKHPVSDSRVRYDGSTLFQIQE